MPTGIVIYPPLPKTLRYLKLLLIRHAESIGNTQKRMEGQRSTPLSHLGQQQAKQLSQALTQSLPSNAVSEALPNPLRIAESLPTHLYSSPLLRATQTATALQQQLQAASQSLPIQQHTDLQELHPGIFQGLTWTEATTQHPDICNRLMASLAWQPVPQAESPAEARARAQDWVDRLLAHHAPGDTIWTVSHAGLMLHIIAIIMGCDRTWKITIPHTAIFEFWIQGTHSQNLGQNQFNPEYWILRRFNDSTHINPEKTTRSDG